MKTISIKQMNEDDRPREKLISKGPGMLSDAELLAIILRTGTKHATAIGLAQHILHQCGGSLHSLSRHSLDDLCKINGIGPAKAVEIMASLEMGKRRVAESNKSSDQITCSKDAFWVIAPMLMDLDTEEFWIVLCNRANRVIDTYKISSGGLHSTVVDVKVLIKKALSKNACGIILAHNHPSGTMKPSSEDISLTKKIKQAASLFEMNVLDHIIVCGNQYYSFADEGDL